jgi:hypothetical protein
MRATTKASVLGLEMKYHVRWTVMLAPLMLGVGMIAYAQQPVEQTKQDQRMFNQHVYRQDQETMLEDPAITNQVTVEQMLPDSNEQNVESRQLKLDDLRRPRFIPSPVTAEGLQFVPGQEYVAGRKQGTMETDMKALAPPLGLQMTWGLSGEENSWNTIPSQVVINSSENALGTAQSSTEIGTTEDSSDPTQSEADVDPYIEPPDRLLTLDHFQNLNLVTNLEANPAKSLAPNLPPWRAGLAVRGFTGLSHLAAATRQPSERPFHRSSFGDSSNANFTCAFKIDPTSPREPAELADFSREGCLSGTTPRHTTRPRSLQNGVWKPVSGFRSHLPNDSNLPVP